MRKRYISSRFERMSGAIDIGVYDRESRFLFIVGICVGCVLGVAINPLLGGYSHQFETTTAVQPHPIPVRFVAIPPLADDISPRPVSRRDIVAAAIDTIPEDQTPAPADETPSPMPEPTETAAEATDLLRAPPDKNPFTPYRYGASPDRFAAQPDTTHSLTWEDTFHGHPDFVPTPQAQQRWEHDMPLSERSIVTLGQGYGSVFWDPLNPIEEEPEDERRRFDPTFLGLPMGRGMTFVVVPGMIGFTPTGLLPSIQHFVKRMKWKHDDAQAMDNRRELAQAGFSVLSEKDIRFLVLLWRHNRLNPDHLTRAERLYIAGATVEYAATNRAHLADMERRGLAVSLEKSGDIVYGATVTRDELIGGLMAAYRQLYAPGTAATDSLLLHDRDMISEYVKLINTSPESVVQAAAPDTGAMQYTSIRDSLSLQPGTRQP